MMLPLSLPWELIGVLILSASCSLANKAINVALQASFNSPPYLLELLLVTIKLRPNWRLHS